MMMERKISTASIQEGPDSLLLGCHETLATLRDLPNDMLILTFSFLNYKDMVRCGSTGHEWHKLFKSKAMSTMLKPLCYSIWQRKESVYSSTKSFLKGFGDWRNMIKLRGFVRVDEPGFYVCRFKYLRQGLNEERMTNPIHEVLSYRYF